MRLCPVLISLVLAFAAAACDDASDDPVPTSTPLAAHGELVVYREVARTIESPERWSPVWRIASYDLRAGREIASFEVGSADDVPMTASIANGRVVIAYQSHVATYALDGSDEQEWYRTPNDGYITGAGSSPDGTMLAVSIQSGDPCATAAASEDGGSCLPIADFMSVFVIHENGDEVLSIQQSDPRFSEFSGYLGSLGPIIWREDGGGFVIRGVKGSEAPGGIATIMLAGDVTVSPVLGYGQHVAPHGRYLQDDDWKNCNLSLAFERHELRIVDALTSAVVAEVREPVRNIAPLQWSPNGDELLYRAADLDRSAGDDGCPRENMKTATWHILRAGGDAPIDVAGVIEARRGWYGDRLIEFECGGQPTEYSECPVGGSSGPARVLNQGRLIAEAVGYETIGYLPATSAE